MGTDQCTDDTDCPGNSVKANIWILMCPEVWLEWHVHGLGWCVLGNKGSVRLVLCQWRSVLNLIPGNRTTLCQLSLACRNRDYTQQKGCCFTFVFDCSRETSGIYQPISESPAHEINWKDSGGKKTPKNHPKTLIKPLSVKFIKERVRTWQPVNSCTWGVILIVCPSFLLRKVQKYNGRSLRLTDLD